MGQTNFLRVEMQQTVMNFYFRQIFLDKGRLIRAQTKLRKKDTKQNNKLIQVFP
jgi:hypothetical protein